MNTAKTAQSKRAIILIDGSNFYFKLKDLGLHDMLKLISSDTDLLPAIKKAREKGKTIEYIGFSHAPSLAMISNCTSSRLLVAKNIKPHYQ